MKLVITLLSIFSLTASAAPNRKVDAGFLEFKQQAAPSNPASGYNRFYVKADGKFYHLNALGVEVEVGAGGGSDATDITYTPTTPADWLSVPTDAQEALDNLAAQRPVINLKTAPAQYTPNFVNAGTASNVDIWWQRDGNNLILHGRVSLTGSASVATMSLPPGLTIDSSVVSSANYRLFGEATFTSSSTYQTFLIGRGGDTTISFGRQDNSNGGLTPSAGNNIAATIAFQSWPIPIAQWSQSTTVDIFGAGDYGWTPYTPTFGAGLGTPSGVTFYHKRIGDTLYVTGAFTGGTVAASYASVSLPSGLAIDPAKIAPATTLGSTDRSVGRYTTNVANVSGALVVATNSSTTNVYFADTQNIAGSLTARFGSTIMASGTYTNVNFSVPIAGWSTFPIGVAGIVGQWENYNSQASMTNTGSNTSIEFFGKRIGDGLSFRGSLVVGSLPGSIVSLDFSSVTFDASKLPATSTGTGVGQWCRKTSTSNLYSGDRCGVIFYDGADNNSLFFAFSGQSGVGYVKATVPFGNGEIIDINIYDIAIN
jgi:hypothetical protein